MGLLALDAVAAREHSRGESCNPFPMRSAYLGTPLGTASRQTGPYVVGPYIHTCAVVCLAAFPPNMEDDS